ncbi:hypothetical protein A3844_06135 [Paenibacillus helianthi]|uniref:F5/8 type C domain-containing protein n=1 Tax=Paenibacillus helianthi TaxID=1349432 RepID=A0ABX3ERR1_9BACL|nr:discoidin domain-containing protein [Paenibacillus helianthi]OKP89558.1 hypothetical protein A3844_06135 [Paenibacillus helianthi]
MKHNYRYENNYLFENPNGTDTRNGSLQLGFEGYTKINLGGGAGGIQGQPVYTAPNGVTVTCSAGPLSSPDYSIKNLFDGCKHAGLLSAGTMWMTNTWDATLTFDFNMLGSVPINRIVLYPHAFSNQFLKYRILSSSNGADWVEQVGNILTTGGKQGQAYVHEVDIAKRYMRFQFIGLNTVISLYEIELYSGPNTLSDGLSGGSGGQGAQLVYTAPNGVIVTSSARSIGSATDYCLANLFNDAPPMDGSSSQNHWLTSSVGNQTLTFNFGAPTKFIGVRVVPRCRDQASSNYRISVSNDGINYSEIVPWVVTTSDMQTPYGAVNEHLISITSQYVQFELTQNASYGVLLGKVSFIKPFPLYRTDAAGFYVTTTDNSQYNTNSAVISKINPTQLEPVGTAIRYLVSTDNRVTWTTFDGQDWVTVGLATIHTSGMTAARLRAVKVNDWSKVTRNKKVDLAIGLRSTNSNLTPVVLSIQSTSRYVGGNTKGTLLGRIKKFIHRGISLSLTDSSLYEPCKYRAAGSVPTSPRTTKIKSLIHRGTSFSLGQDSAATYIQNVVRPSAVSPVVPIRSGVLRKYVHTGTCFVIFEYIADTIPGNRVFNGHHFSVGLENETITPRVLPEEWHPLDLYVKIEEKQVRPYRQVQQYWERYPQK